MSKEINVENIRSFLEGNYKYYKKIFVRQPDHIQEQLAYRLSKCGDCVKAKACVGCGCPPIKKHFVSQSCNPDRFPDLMEAPEWEKFKKKLDGEELHDKEEDDS